MTIECPKYDAEPSAVGFPVAFIEVNENICKRRLRQRETGIDA